MISRTALTSPSSMARRNAAFFLASCDSGFFGSRGGTSMEWAAAWALRAAITSCLCSVRTASSARANHDLP